MIMTLHYLLIAYDTTDLDKLVKAAVTINILSIVVTSPSVGFLIKRLEGGQQGLYISSLVVL